MKHNKHNNNHKTNNSNNNSPVSSSYNNNSNTNNSISSSSINNSINNSPSINILKNNKNKNEKKKDKDDDEEEEDDGNVISKANDKHIGNNRLNNKSNGTKNNNNNKIQTDSIDSSPSIEANNNNINKNTNTKLKGDWHGSDDNDARDDKQLNSEKNINNNKNNINNNNIINHSGIHISVNDSGTSNNVNNKTSNVNNKMDCKEDETKVGGEGNNVDNKLVGPTANPAVIKAKSNNSDKIKTARRSDAEKESFLIEGVLFRAQYLGSTQLVSEGQPSKATRLMQAQEAINRIKDPALKANPRPGTLVDLFVSVEKIMVLNTDLQEIMMDHALRTISYIADIGDVLVIMARRGPVSNTDNNINNNNNTDVIDGNNCNDNSSGKIELDGKVSTSSHFSANHSQAKICCHVFESDEAQLIAQSISQAFQVAYVEFLKANGINDPDLIKGDYQDVLSQQEVFGEELFLFSNRDMQKEVLVPKGKGEPLGMVIVESGWGSMVPTVVLANMAPGGAAARGGQLNIGDQIISVNGISLVGLPLSTCQAHLKARKGEELARLIVVSCTPVVEVLVKRPDIKYQLGFSVQNGVICSLLRGGIAERGGVRVGHRIIEINGQSVVAVPHDKIVSTLASSVGEIHMKTMQTSIYRLLTGQDTPHYI